MTDPRIYPDRPYLAVSAAIIRDQHVLVARRAKGASTSLYTLPGGVVEVGETLHQAVVLSIHKGNDWVRIAGALMNGDPDNPYNGTFKILDTPDAPTLTTFNCTMAGTPTAASWSAWTRCL